MIEKLANYSLEKIGLFTRIVNTNDNIVYNMCILLPNLNHNFNMELLMVYECYFSFQNDNELKIW